MIQRIRRLLGAREGQGLTEYIIMVAMIAISAIAVVNLFGQQVKNIWNAAVHQLSQVHAKHEADAKHETDAKHQKGRAHEGGKRHKLGDFGLQ